MTSSNSPSATSSPASAGGPSLSHGQDGHQTDLFGPGLVPANPSPRPGSKQDSMTNDTSGRRSIDSLTSADLQLCLANRLVDHLGINGSPEYSLTWKSQDIKWRVPICRLAPSEPRTLDRDSTGWRSPIAQRPGRSMDLLVDKDGNPWTPGKRAYNKETGQLCQVSLKQEVKAAWPTPRCAMAASTEDSIRDNLKRKGFKSRIEEAAVLATDEAIDMPARDRPSTWSTPTSNQSQAVTGETGEKEVERQIERGQTSLLADAHLASGWPSPVASEARQGVQNRETGKKGTQKSLTTVVVESTVGLEESGSRARMGSPGGLNPALARWLQGYPAVWDFCGVMAMQSPRNSRRPSSSPSSEPKKT